MAVYYYLPSGASARPLIVVTGASGNIDLIRQVGPSSLFTAGQLIATDAGQFTWSATSTATDDGQYVLRPADVASGAPGRWLYYVAPGVSTATGIVYGNGTKQTSLPVGNGLEANTDLHVLAADSTVNVTGSGLSVQAGLDSTLAAAKAYAESLAYGISSKAPVHLATTGALPSYTVSGDYQTLTASANGVFPLIDGHALAVTERILVKDETAQANNGIYSLTNAGSGSTKWVLTRTSDANSATELCGALTSVQEGTANAGTVWNFAANPATFILGTTAVIFTRLSVSSATTTSQGIVQLAGDLSGTASAPTVTGLQTYAVDSTSPISGDLLQYTGSQWSHVQRSVSTTAPLTGGGSLSSSLTIALASGTTTGNTLGWNGTAWAPAALNLGGGAGYVSGTLPTGNGGTGLTTYSAGALLYSPTASTVASLSGSATGNTLRWNGTTWSAGALDLSNSNAVTGALPVANGGTGVTTLASGNLLVAQSSSTLAAVAMSGDATITTAGSVTVGRINGATVSTSAGALTAGNVLRVTGLNTVDYGPVDLSNNNAITGTLPVSNQAAPTGTGFAGVVAGAWSAAAVSGTNALAGFNGSTPSAVTVSSPLAVSAGVLSIAQYGAVTGNALRWNGASWVPSALNLAGGTGYVTGTLPAANQAAQTMGGDISGTTASATVAKFSTNTVPASAGTAGNVLQVGALNTMSFGPLNLGGGATYVTGTLPAANQSAQTMGGDVTGTTAAATVAKLQGNAVSSSAPTTGNTLGWNGTAWAPAALNLAGGSAYVSGSLPAANQAAQTMGGDVSGTTASATVAKINGSTVPAGGSLTTGQVLRATGVASLAYGAVDLANSAAVTGTLPASFQAAQTMGGDVSGTTASATVAKINGSALGTTTPTSGNLLIGSGSQWVTQAMSGDATLSSTGTLTLGVTGVSAASYGSATQVATFAVDYKGRLTAAGNTSIAIAGSQVTSAVANATTAVSFSGSLAGDVTGTQSATVVAKINGSTVPAGGALATGQVLRATGASTLGYGAVDLANGSAVTGVLPLANHAGPATASAFGYTSTSGTWNSTGIGGTDKLVGFNGTTPSAITVGSGLALSGGTLTSTGSGGTVTSVALSTGSTGLTVGGGTTQTITSSGTFNLAGTLAIANGGTGSTSQVWVGLSGNDTASGNKTFTGQVTVGTGTSLVQLSGLSLQFVSNGGVGNAQLGTYTSAATSTNVGSGVSVAGQGGSFSSATTGGQVAVSGGGGNGTATAGGTGGAAVVSGGAGGNGSTTNGNGGVLSLVSGDGGTGTGTGGTSGDVYLDVGGANSSALLGTIRIGTLRGAPIVIGSTSNLGTTINGSLSLQNALTPSNGGTGNTAPTANGQLLIGSSGGTYTKTTLTAGSGVSITNGAGSITIAATGGGGGTATYTAVTTSTTLTLTGNNVVACTTAASAITVNLPTAVGISGYKVTIKRTTSSTVVIDPNGSETVDGAATHTLSVPNQSVTLFSDGANWQISEAYTPNTIGTTYAVSTSNYLV